MGCGGVRWDGGDTEGTARGRSVWDRAVWDRTIAKSIPHLLGPGAEEQGVNVELDRALVSRGWPGRPGA